MFNDRFGARLCTAEELAAIFGEEVKRSISSGKSPEFIALQARFAFRLAGLALDKRDRSQEYVQSKTELDRLFAVLAPMPGVH